jgi:hypothetical protein
VYQFRCSDGVQVGGQIGSGWSDGTKAVFGGGYAFIPSISGPSHRVSSAGAWTALSALTGSRFAYDGTNLWLATTSGLKKATLGGSVLATYLPGVSITEVECGGANVWVAYSGTLTRIRGSDGAWIDANGNVSATQVTYSVGDTLGVQAMCWDGEDLWLTASSSVSGRVSRLRGSNGVHVETLAPLYGACGSVVRGGDNMWFVTGPSQYSPAVAWRYQAFLTQVLPKLTAVDPGVGPHISLTFDNPVGITGPTIGPASSGIQVDSVTQIDTTHIDLNLTVAGSAPAAPIGSATNDLGPEAPSGGAVNSDPTPPVPVAGAWREPT